MARKQTTDSDDERAVDKLLASWPVGTLATDEERAKMGMEPMDPRNGRSARPRLIKTRRSTKAEIARLEGEGLQVSGRPPPPKVGAEAQEEEAEEAEEEEGLRDAAARARAPRVLSYAS